MSYFNLFTDGTFFHDEWSWSKFITCPFQANPLIGSTLIQHSKRNIKETSIWNKPDVRMSADKKKKKKNHMDCDE